eukprot:scaffold8828_cov129-Isochrysis_galbana.AAC.1
MLTTQLHGQMIEIDVPGAPPVRLRASVALDLLGLSHQNRTTDLVALGAFLLFHLALTTAIVSAKLRPPVLSGRGGGLPRAGRWGGEIAGRPKKQNGMPVEAAVAALHEEEDDVPAFVLGDTDERASVSAATGRRPGRLGARDSPALLLADQDQVLVEMVEQDRLLVEMVGQDRLLVEVGEHGTVQQGGTVDRRLAGWPHHDMD